MLGRHLYQPESLRFSVLNLKLPSEICIKTTRYIGKRDIILNVGYALYERKIRRLSMECEVTINKSMQKYLSPVLIITL